MDRLARGLAQKPERASMTGFVLPTREEIAQLGDDLSFRFPDSYRQFLRAPPPQTLASLKRICPDGWFVTSKAELGILAEEYRRSLIPFFINGRRELIPLKKDFVLELPTPLSVFGFDILYKSAPKDEVAVARRHATPGQWASFEEWTVWVEWLDRRRSRAN